MVKTVQLLSRAQHTGVLMWNVIIYKLQLALFSFCFFAIHFLKDICEEARVNHKQLFVLIFYHNKNKHDLVIRN